MTAPETPAPASAVTEEDRALLEALVRVAVVGTDAELRPARAALLSHIGRLREERDRYREWWAELQRVSEGRPHRPGMDAAASPETKEP